MEAIYKQTQRQIRSTANRCITRGFIERFLGINGIEKLLDNHNNKIYAVCAHNNIFNLKHEHAYQGKNLNILEHEG